MGNVISRNASAARVLEAANKVTTIAGARAGDIKAFT